MKPQQLFLLSSLAFAGTFISCTDEPEITYGEFEDRGPTIEATVSLSVPQGGSGFKTVWEDGDVIGIFEPGTPSNPRDFRLTEGAESEEGTFFGKLPVSDSETPESGHLFAIWPYDWYAGSSSGADAYSLALPSEQNSGNYDTEYIAGYSADNGRTFTTSRLVSILDVTVTGLPEDETLRSLGFSSTPAAFASAATVDLTDEQFPLSVSEQVSDISSEVVSGNTASFKMFPQDFSAMQAEMNVVITTDKTVYNQVFDGFGNIRLEAGKTAEMTVEVADRYGEGGFVFAESETARPGEGEYADAQVIPIRGEILDKATSLPYSFVPNTASGEQVLRIWFISTQEATAGKYFSLKDFSGTFGFDGNAIAEKFYTGSQVSVTDADCEYDRNRHYFFSQEDALKYKVSYVDFSIDAKFVQLFDDEFSIECTIVGSKDGSDSFISAGEEMKVPVSVHASPYILHLDSSESARPGEGEYAAYNFLPIRGEYIVSKNTATATPYVFTAGQPTAGIAFRVWMISKKGYTVPTNGDNYNSENDWGSTYLLGAEIAEIEEKFGTGSGVGFGTAAAKKLLSGTPGYVFDNENDNSAYVITYVDFDVNIPSNKNLPDRFKEGYILNNANTATVTMHLKKATNNQDPEAPQTLTIPVTLTCNAVSE